METIVVIPARGGSVRIPLKNLQVVGGLPLVARAVRLARASARIGGVIVSTDHPEIAALAGAEGAELVQRPAEISGDETPVEAALVHVLETLEARGAVPKIAVLLYCTAPLTTVEDLDGTIVALAAEGADTALAAAPERKALWTSGGPGVGAAREGARIASPGPTRFLEAGSVYAMRVGGFLQSKSLLFGKTALYPIDPARLLRIETPADLYRARQLAGQAPLPRQDHAVIYVDVDETICINQPDRDYRRAVPIPENVAAVNRLYDRGHTIVYWTARGGQSAIDYAELTRGQLDAWGARYHRLVMGKPSYDLLICDKATRSIPAV